MIRAFTSEGLTLHPRLEFDPIGVIAALIMFVIAEVFREGARGAMLDARRALPSAQLPTGRSARVDARAGTA